MKRVYIISRYAARDKKERRFNKQVARHFCREILRQGNHPVAPHLFYPQFCDDNSLVERAAGLQLALADLDSCDSFLLVIIDGVISSGMRGELEYLSRRGGIKGCMVAMSREDAKRLIRGR